MDQPNTSQEHVDIAARRVAHVYADALMRAATKEGVEDLILDEYDSLVHDLLDQDSRLNTLLSEAALGRNAREEVIRKVFADRAHRVLTNFLLVLSQHERMDLIRPVLTELRHLHDAAKGRTRVHVTSAVPLDHAQQDHLADNLKHTFGVDPVLVMDVDPSILGGLKVRIGDLQYDASVRTRIDNLRHQILARSSHEIQSRRDSIGSSV